MERAEALAHSLRSCPRRDLIGSAAAERYPLAGLHRLRRSIRLMTSENDVAVRVRSFDVLLQKIDERIAGIALPVLSRPGRGKRGSKAQETLDALVTEVDRLCVESDVCRRGAERWCAMAEQSVRVNDDVRAKEALIEHAAHLTRLQEVNAQLHEFRELAAEAKRVLRADAHAAIKLGTNAG